MKRDTPRGESVHLAVPYKAQSPHHCKNLRWRILRQVDPPNCQVLIGHGLPSWQRSLTISPALPCSRIFRIIDPAAALYRARNVHNTGIELRGRTASARGTYMENTGVGLRVGRNV